jgi:hypothetical protein
LAGATLAAADPPRVTLMSTLPLIWGEGSVEEILSGDAQPVSLLAGLNVTPIDVIISGSLNRDIALLIQPRRLSPQELVAFDQWVREGGRAVIFVDPALRWGSRYPLGDPRRPPPVTLLDPLFRHWGLMLDDADGKSTPRKLLEVDIVTHDAGQWRGGKNCAVLETVLIRCAIGRGTVILVADADLLDAQQAGDALTDPPALLKAVIALADGRQPRVARLPWIGGAIVGFMFLFGTVYLVQNRNKARL